MSIIVRDMRMPKNCCECPFESYSINTGLTFCLASMKVMATKGKVIKQEDRPKWCPLFECKSLDQT